jgi:hypothetical protein
MDEPPITIELNKIHIEILNLIKFQLFILSFEGEIAFSFLGVIAYRFLLISHSIQLNMTPNLVVSF